MPSSPSTLFPHLPAKLAAKLAAYDAARKQVDSTDDRMKAQQRILDREPLGDGATPQARNARETQDIEAEQLRDRFEDDLLGQQVALRNAADALYSQVLNSDPEENPWVNSTQLQQRVIEANAKAEKATRDFAHQERVLSQELAAANKRIDRLEGTAIDALMDLRDAKADVAQLQMRVSI